MSSNSEKPDQNPYTASTAPAADSNASGNPVQDAYWSKSLVIVGVILSLWAFVSLGCGIVFRDLLDSVVPNIGGAPFGFWMAQQGSIFGFLILLFLYMVLMNRLDRKHGFGDEGKQ